MWSCKDKHSRSMQAAAQSAGESPRGAAGDSPLSRVGARPETASQTAGWAALGRSPAQGAGLPGWRSGALKVVPTQPTITFLVDARMFGDMLMHAII